MRPQVGTKVSLHVISNKCFSVGRYFLGRVFLCDLFFNLGRRATDVRCENNAVISLFPGLTM